MSKFIVIEGLDGAGKSSLINSLNPQLSKLTDLPIIQTREPYGGEVYSLIKNIIKTPNLFDVYQDSLLYLFMADRRMHLDQIVLPALKEGKIIISDRYFPSTMAYQERYTPDEIYEIHKIGKFKKPDLTINLKIPVDVALKRLSARNEQDIFEKQSYLERISKRYEDTFQILAGEGWNILEVDGTELLEINVINILETLEIMDHGI